MEICQVNGAGLGLAHSLYRSYLGFSLETSAELWDLQPFPLQVSAALFSLILLVRATHSTYGSQECARETKIRPAALCCVLFIGLGDRSSPRGDFCLVLEGAQGRADV